MISIIIPAHREPYLQKTIDSLLEGAVGDVEILPVLDGWNPEKPSAEQKRRAEADNPEGILPAAPG